MLTLGIDAAAQPKATWACSVEWAPGRPVVRALRSGLSDTDLAAVIPTAEKVGIDAPLGWPDEFVEAVVAHHERARWPGAADPEAHRYRLRLRETDRVLMAAGGRPPLSVSTDRIGIVAMRFAAVLDRLAGDGHPVDRGGAGRVCEAYPAAALRAWGLNATGYKGNLAAQRIPHLLESIERSLGGLRYGDVDRSAIAANHDAFDALVCALVARAAALGLTTGPEPGEQSDRAAREGWIHVPVNPLEDLPA